MKLENAGKKTDYGTTMQCFCNYEKEHKHPYDGFYTGGTEAKPVKAAKATRTK